jgi:hypothetical protein
MANLEKAEKFRLEHNWPQTLRYADLAITKLKKQLKVGLVEDLSDAMMCRFYGLNMMARYKEALECAKEWYCLHLTKHTHPPAIKAGFALIESCIHNKEFVDAELYARTTWETITLSRDSHIPDNKRQQFTAEGAYYLAKAMLSLARDGDVPPEANQTAGQEAIALARRALEMRIQMHGVEHEHVACTMGLLARALQQR